MTFITKIGIRNFRSIRQVVVDLNDLNFLVGPNGSGKSNFLEAFAFLGDVFSHDLDHAVRIRGGSDEVFRKIGVKENWDDPLTIAFRFKVEELSISGSYLLSLRKGLNGKLDIEREECRVCDDKGTHTFSVDSKLNVSSSTGIPFPAPSDRPLLSIAGGFDEFAILYSSLRDFEVYNLNVSKLRDPQAPSSRKTLSGDGDNIASIVGNMNDDDKKRMETYLGRIVPGFKGLHVDLVSRKELLKFRFEALGRKKGLKFGADSVSDGTLRALGILVAGFQHRYSFEHNIPLIGLEEPEAALHPGAAGILLAALQEVAEERQVLITSHSPDLLDSEHLKTDAILAVEMREGETRIAHIDDVSRESIRENLFSVGELLRMNQIAPDPGELKDIEQVDFDREFFDD